MWASASAAKVAATRGYGATVDLEAPGPTEAFARLEELQAASGRTLVHPFDGPRTIAGQGTVGVEIAEDVPHATVVVVPIGGGGLISGISLAVKVASTTAEVAGVEVAASNPFTRGLEAGRIVTIDVQPTLADGLAGNLDPETVTFEIVRQNVTRIALVDEQQLRDAVAGILDREQLVAEGAAAVGVAALRGGTLDVRGKRVAVVLSGGNIDNERLSAISSQLSTQKGI